MVDFRGFPEHSPSIRCRETVSNAQMGQFRRNVSVRRFVTPNHGGFWRISAGKTEQLALLFPGFRQFAETLQFLRRQFDRLPAGKDRLDDIGSQERQGQESADVTFVYPLLAGNFTDSGYLALGNPIDPLIRIGHKTDKAAIG